MDTLDPTGIIIPEGPDNISASGVAEMRRLGETANIAIAPKIGSRLLAGTGPYDVFTLERGMYTIANATAVAATANLPEQVPGTVLVVGALGSPLTSITFYPYQRDYHYVIISSGFTGTPATPTFPEEWQKITPGTTFTKGIAPSTGYDIFTLESGVYTFSNTTVVGNSLNLPEQQVGVALVMRNTQSPITAINYYPYQRDYFYTITASGFTGTPPAPTFPDEWQRIPGEGGGSGEVGAQTDLGQSHIARRTFFRRRRGGVIGTGGKPVICLRGDHGLNNFQDLILPEILRLGLPYSMAMNSAQNRWDLPESNEVTPEDLDGWATDYGVEVWNHSQTHGSAETLEALTREIVTGLTDLQALIPSVPIEGFVIPGVPSGNYAGFSAGETPERWDTMAGRLIMGYHAVSSSHMPGTDGPLTGDQSILGRQYGIDSLDAAAVIPAIDRAVARGAGMIVFLHASQLDLSGKISTADYTAVLEHIAALRDAGAVEVTTMGGLSVADATTDYRHDVIEDGTFQNGTEAWGSPANWVVASDGSVTTGTSTSSLTQEVDFTGREWLQGGPRDLVVTVRARAGSVVNVEVTRGTVVHRTSIPAGTEGWTDIHMAGIVPLGATSQTVRIRRVSGDYIHVGSVKWVSI